MTSSTSLITAVRFGSHQDYRISGDTAELRATFVVTHRSAHERAWALQLWACPSIPTSTDEMIGHLVAEAPLPPLVEIAGEGEPFAVTAAAHPPAGDRDHSMVLVLASRRSSGAYDEVHDVAAFPRRERFPMPRLVGAVSFTRREGGLALEPLTIENPRDAANLSGTLSLELWGLDEPYSGGQFTGAPLGGVLLGSLVGQSRWSALPIESQFSTPPANRPHVVVMLREWTGAEFITRDFRNLGILVEAPAATPAAEPTPTPVVSAPVAAVVAPSAPAPTPAPQPVTASTPATVSAAAPATSAAPEPAGISINSASLQALRSIKGLPRNVAEQIVKARPFARLEDLVRLKGVGDKLFARIRSQLRL